MTTPPLTIADFVALPEESQHRRELHEGALVMSPSPTARHMRAIRRLIVQLESHRLIRASEVLLVVEMVSPGSVRMDHVIKRAEYADAGIDRHWIIDLDSPVTLIARHQAGDPGYADDGEITNTYTTAEPFPLTLDLPALC